MKKYISSISEVRNKGSKEAMTREEQSRHQKKCDKFPLLRRNCVKLHQRENEEIHQESYIWKCVGWDIKKDQSEGE